MFPLKTPSAFTKLAITFFIQNILIGTHFLPKDLPKPYLESLLLVALDRGPAARKAALISRNETVLIVIKASP